MDTSTTAWVERWAQTEFAFVVWRPNQTGQPIVHFIYRGVQP